MRKIKVFLRLSKKSHPLYEELFNNPPKNIEYVFRKDMEHYSKKDTSFKTKIKNFFWGVFNKRMPPFAPIKYEDCDLIHSTNNIMILGKKPWIIDTESGHGLLGFKYELSKKKYFLEIAKKILNQKSCKKILCWSEICRKAFLDIFGKDFENKVEVVYPSHHAVKIDKKKKQKKKVKLLFVSRRFQEKGGYELLRAFDKIKNKHNCELVMISMFSREILEKYKGDKKIKLIEAKLSRDEVAKHFKEADIFVYPNRIDTYGFVIIEAMAYGLPVITMDLYAIPEMIKNGKNGLLINPLLKWHDKDGKHLWKNDTLYYKRYEEAYQKNKDKYCKDIALAMEKLIKNKKLREKMGLENFKEVSKGKFSIEHRNKKLEKIYSESLG
jgi:glycosyltransferase involved in cell wall biosynthesis